MRMNEAIKVLSEHKVQKVIQGGFLSCSNVERTATCTRFSKGEWKGVATGIGGNPGVYNAQKPSKQFQRGGSDSPRQTMLIGQKRKTEE